MIGRFAPSPTGSLHMGSLVAAIASYCDAKKNNGQWLLRVEDLDPLREVVGASESFTSTLQSFGFMFNQNILHQSQKSRQQAYQNALNELTKQGQVYYCSCSRNELKGLPLEQHKCRNSQTTPSKPFSINLKVPNQQISFIDKIQGKYCKNLLSDCGDCVLKRKDGLFSYQLAVVVDDNFQNITDIVRGIDLIESTPWQIHLNALLNYKQPSYSHIPILVNDLKQKLSKQTFAQEVNTNKPVSTLIKAYEMLLQTSFIRVPTTVEEFWNEAIMLWNPNKLSNIKEIKV